MTEYTPRPAPKFKDPRMTRIYGTLQICFSDKGSPGLSASASQIARGVLMNCFGADIDLAAFRRNAARVLHPDCGLPLLTVEERGRAFQILFDELRSIERLAA